MKKKIAFISKKMDIGGIEKAALSILELLDSSKYDVDYYFRRRNHENIGELIKYIPKWVNKKEIAIPNKSNYKRYFLTTKERIVFWKNYIQSYFYKNADVAKQYSMQANMGVKIKEEYDIAIAFDGPKAYGVFYTIDAINAKKKILWIHGDIQKENAVTPFVEQYYSSYDRIITVSQEAKKVLLDTFPKLKDKVEVVYNYVNYNEIRNLAEEEVITPFENYRGLKITTVGRLGEDKGMLMAAQCCKMLVDCHMDVKWVLCGDGPEKEKIERFVKQNNLSDSFILVGNRANPYPYIKACDIYVQPSIREGFCTTTNEAKVLCKPVVTTDVCGMKEQFQNNITGLIVDISADGLYEGIQRLVNNNDLIKRMQNKLEDWDWNKQTDYNKLLDEFID